MKVFVVHNRYQQTGGEDQVVESEARLLSAAGYRVVHHDRDNREIKKRGYRQRRSGREKVFEMSGALFGTKHPISRTSTILSR